MGYQNIKNTRETNSDIHIVSNIMKNVMRSAAGAEVRNNTVRQK